MGSVNPHSRLKNNSVHLIQTGSEGQVSHEQILAAASNATILIGQALGLNFVNDDRCNTTPSVPIQNHDILQVAMFWNRAIQLKDEVLGSDLAGAPIWLLLLDLYIHYRRNIRVSVSSACIASGLQPTTALRWLAALGQADLVHRSPDTKDRRRIFVSLTPLAIAKIEEILERAGAWDQRSRG